MTVVRSKAKRSWEGWRGAGDGVREKVGFPEQSVWAGEATSGTKGMQEVGEERGVFVAFGPPQAQEKRRDEPHSDQAYSV